MLRKIADIAGFLFVWAVCSIAATTTTDMNQYAQLVCLIALTLGILGIGFSLLEHHIMRHKLEAVVHAIQDNLPQVAKAGKYLVRLVDEGDVT